MVTSPEHDRPRPRLMARARGGVYSHRWLSGLVCTMACARPTNSTRTWGARKPQLVDGSWQNPSVVHQNYSTRGPCLESQSSTLSAWAKVDPHLHMHGGASPESPRKPTHPCPQLIFSGSSVSTIGAHSEARLVGRHIFDSEAIAL